MRVAIVHYWLVGMRGGEKVVEALCRLYPQADIFTHVCVAEKLSPRLRAHRIRTTFIARLPFACRLYKAYLPLMPIALEQLDLSGYDLVISSESGPAKGVVVPAQTLHVCYCHSPMRYIWNLYHAYRRRAGPLTRLAMPVLAHFIRLWDVSTHSRVQHFVANSRCVAGRIKSYYGREATVIYPPVEVGDFAPVDEAELGDFFLVVGELVAYKRVDLAIEAFNRSGRALVVIGGGEELRRLRRLAKPNVRVLGARSFEDLRWHYARCRALIFPGEEDFGLVPVEAMASGRPVIAFARGGALESVADGVSGLFFREQTVDSLAEAIARFDRTTFDRAAIARSAQRFAATCFEASFAAFVSQRLSEHRDGGDAMEYADPVPMTPALRHLAST